MLKLGSAAIDGLAAIRALDLPGWAAIPLVVLCLGAMCLWVVFPQDSRDKVAWWREYWGRVPRDLPSCRRCTIGSDADEATVMRAGVIRRRRRRRCCGGRRTT